MPNKSIDDLRDEYIGAINRSNKIRTEVTEFLRGRSPSSEGFGQELARLLDADKQAEGDAMNARDAYQQALAVGDKFGKA